MAMAGVSEMSLLTNLISYWKLDEASGDAVDAHGSNDLTQNATIGTADGKIGSARSFTTDPRFLSRASNASLQCGDISFTLSAWVYLTATTFQNRWIASKDNTSPAGSREHSLLYGNNDRFRFFVFRATDAFVGVDANSFGVVSLNEWVHVIAWHDAIADTISIQVNNGTVDTASTGGVLQSPSAANFQLGKPAFSMSGNQFLGRIDEVGFWKRVLTSSERSQLYNSGNGLSYDSFATSTLWTPANIATALWLDASDSSTLFDATSGGSAVAADGAVARWQDKSGNARHVTQSGTTARPLRKTSVQNSKDVLRFDGSNDNFVIPGFISTQPVFACGVYQTSVNNSPFLGSSGVSTNNTAMIGRRSTGTHIVFGGTVLVGGTHGSEWLIRSDLLNSTNSYIFANGSSVASGDAGTRHTITRVGVNLTDFANGDLGEIVLLLSVPTTDTRQLIEGYLAHKWGLAGSLPSDHPYKSSAPTTGTIQTRRRRDLGGFGL